MNAPATEQRERIIRGFGPKELVKFIGCGGHLPVSMKRSAMLAKMGEYVREFNPPPPSIVFVSGPAMDVKEARVVA